jgi:hypothetical protein
MMANQTGNIGIVFYNQDAGFHGFIVAGRDAVWSR